jgi:CRISPR-associated protein Cas1
VGICLPDETNLLLHQLEDNTEETPPPVNGLRKLLPARQHALPLYVQQQGAFVGKTGDLITVKLKGEELLKKRLLDISQVCVYGNVMFSAHAIKELTAKKIPIVHLTYGGWFHSLTTGLHHKNVELRIQQYRIASDPAAALAIARQLIAGKVKNCRTLLRRHAAPAETPVLRQLAEYYKRVHRAESAETLLGLEGMAAKEYFSAFLPLLSGHQEFDVNGRNRRPPRDPVNAVLSFVYSLLTKEITVALSSVGFDPMLGFFHRPRYGRPSLALDLAEEFRPLIADSVVLTVFNNGEVQRDSFISRAGSVAMTDAGRRSVIAAYERRLDTEITHPLFGYKVNYRRILEVQSRLLARHVLGELPAYPNFITR